MMEKIDGVLIYYWAFFENVCSIGDAIGFVCDVIFLKNFHREMDHGVRNKIVEKFVVV